MNKEKIKGSWKIAKGRVKEELGHATGDTSTEAEGVADQIKGKLQKGFGKAKDALKKGVDAVVGS